MKPLTDWTRNELQLRLRDLHGARSTKGMQLALRIKRELDRREGS
jgi:hypothetical protein